MDDGPVGADDAGKDRGHCGGADDDDPGGPHDTPGGMESRHGNDPFQLVEIGNVVCPGSISGGNCRYADQHHGNVYQRGQDQGNENHALDFPERKFETRSIQGGHLETDKSPWSQNDEAEDGKTPVHALITERTEHIARQHPGKAEDQRDDRSGKQEHGKRRCQTS